LKDHRAVGFTSPATRFRIVDLPLPDGPSRQTNSPAAIRKETSWRISTEECFVRRVSETASRVTLASVRTAGLATAVAPDGAERGSIQAFANANTGSLY
jgi:hypothetical protein